MADGSRTVKIEILGDAAKAIKALDDTGTSGNKLEESLGKNGEGIGNFAEGAAKALGVLAVAAGGVETIKSSVDAALELGAATKTLDQETGMAAEDSSSLIAAFERYGIPADEASKSLGFLSKQIEGSHEALNGLPGGLTASTDHLKQMGIEVDGANGKLRPMQDILGDVADKFKDMPDGPEKTALAMQLFGKAGKDMIPVLDKGKEGMSDLQEESKKLGLTLSGDNVDQIEKFRLAQVSMGEAIGGVKLQLGVALMPLLTQLATLVINGAEAFNKNAVPAIKAFISTVSNDLQPVLSVVGDFFSKGIVPALQWLGGQKELLTAFGIAVGVIAGAWGILTIATTAWNIVGGIAEAIMAAIESPVILVVAAIALLAAGIYLLVKNWDAITEKVPILGKAFDAIKETITVFKDGIEAAFKFITGVISDHAEQIKTILSTAWNVISTVIETATAVIRDIIKVFLDLTSGNWSGAWKDIQDIFSSIWDAIKTILGTAIEAIKNVLSLAWDSIKGVASTVWNAIWGVITGIAGNIRDDITTKITDAKNMIYNIWTALKTDASNMWNDILTTIINLAFSIRDKITNAITDAKNALYNIWTSLGQDAINAWNGLKKFFGDGAQLLLDTLLKPFKDFKDQVGGFLTGIPGVGGIVSFVGGNIPHAASGAYVTSPTILLSGEGHDPEGEITSPVSMMRKVIREEMGSGNVQVTQHITGVTPEQVLIQTKKALRHAALERSV